jgi:hypothetical protein
MYCRRIAVIVVTFIVLVIVVEVFRVHDAMNVMSRVVTAADVWIILLRAGIPIRVGVRGRVRVVIGADM